MTATTETATKTTAATGGAMDIDVATGTTDHDSTHYGGGTEGRATTTTAAAAADETAAEGLELGLGLAGTTDHGRRGPTDMVGADDGRVRAWRKTKRGKEAGRTQHERPKGGRG